MTQHQHKGECFCGAIQFTVTGTPEGMGFCHCASCRSWSAAPVNAFSLWTPQSIKVTQGAEFIGEFHKTDRSYRKFCTKCGGHLMTDHPKMELVDVYASMLPDLEFQPGLHVHYAEKVLSMPDGLPKYADLPAELGGSGETRSDLAASV